MKKLPEVSFGLGLGEVKPVGDCAATQKPRTTGMIEGGGEVGIGIAGKPPSLLRRLGLLGTGTMMSPKGCHHQSGSFRENGYNQDNDGLKSLPVQVQEAGNSAQGTRVTALKAPGADGVEVMPNFTLGLPKNRHRLGQVSSRCREIRRELSEPGF